VGQYSIGADMQMTKTAKLTYVLLLLMFGRDSAYADVGPGMIDAFAILLLFPFFLMIIPVAARQGTRLVWFLVTLISYPISTWLMLAYFDLFKYEFNPVIVLEATAIWIVITVALVASSLRKAYKNKKTEVVSQI
jgi:hypothetical protein